MIRLYNFDELKPEEILNRDIRAEKNVEDVVDAIIADVRARGDDALKDYALKFDGAEIENLQVTQAEIDEAFAGMDPYFLETLRQAAENIEHVIDVLKDLLKNPEKNRDLLEPHHVDTSKYEQQAQTVPEEVKPTSDAPNDLNPFWQSVEEHWFPEEKESEKPNVANT